MVVAHAAISLALAVAAIYFETCNEISRSAGNDLQYSILDLSNLVVPNAQLASEGHGGGRWDENCTQLVGNNALVPDRKDELNNGMQD